MADGTRYDLFKRPKSVRINPTSRCDFRCRHCYIWQNKGERDLPPEAWDPIMRAISRWLGPVEIHIAGGEPLLSESTPRILAAGAELFLPMGIATNGWHLDKVWARVLSDSQVRTVNFALDGFMQLHDKMRGVPGAFKSVLEAAGCLNYFGVVRPRVTCVIMKDNLDQILEFTDFVCRGMFNGIFFQALAWPFGRPPKPEWWKTSPHWPDDILYVNHVLGELLKMKKSGLSILNTDEQFAAMAAYFADPARFIFSECNVGNTDLTIDADGSVRLCPLENPIGNAREKDLEDIWYSEEAEACRGKMRQCRTHCHLLINCAFDNDLVKPEVRA